MQAAGYAYVYPAACGLTYNHGNIQAGFADKLLGA